MNEKRIREIFLENLKYNSPNEALVKTHSDVAKDILVQTYKDQTVDQTTWDMFIKITKSVARLNLYGSLFDSGVGEIALGPESFDDIAYFFQTWRDALSHIVDNYDQLVSQRVKAQYSQEYFKIALERMDKYMAESALETSIKGFVILSKNEFKALYLGPIWVLRFLMGEDKYTEFVSEFDKHLPYMQMYYLQIVTAPEDKKSS